MTLLRKLAIGVSLVGPLVVSGCGVQRLGTSAVAHGAAGISGRVHGGQQGVGYSTVQLYTVGTTGDGTASTPILMQTVTSDASGSFSLTGLYNCSGATLVYITARGGDPTPTTTNPQLAMMTALGPCSALTSNTFITINELTTVAAVSALAPYMTSITAVGSGTSDVSGLTAAFTLAGEFVDPSQGVSPGSGVPAGTSVPTSEIDSLANAAAACINSIGGVAGNGTACGNLFSWTTPTNGTAATNTVDALLSLAKNPGLNTSSIYFLGSSTSPFQPSLTAPPANFQVMLVADAGTAALTVSPSSLTFSGTAVGFSSIGQTVTITNSGTGSVTLNSVSVTGANVGDFAVANGCGLSLLPGAICTATIMFTPSAMGARSANLQVNSSTAGSPQFVSLSGTGTAPSAGPVSTSVSQLKFTIGSTTEDFTLLNYGNTPLTIASITESDSHLTVSNSGGPYFKVAGNTCGSMLAAQSVCTISVESLAAGTDTYEAPISYNGTLTISDDAAAGPQTVALNTTAAYSVYPGSFTYSQVGVAQTVMFGGLGSYYVRETFTPTVGGTNAGDFSAPTPCYDGTPPCSFPVVFKPTAAGLRTAKLYVIGDALQYVPIAGTGVGPGPFFVITQTSLSLSNDLPSSPDPNSNIASTGTLTITNYGTTTLALSGTFAGTGASFLSYNGGSGCTALAPNTSCMATVTFGSTVVGKYPAVLTLKDPTTGFSASLPIAAETDYWQISARPNSMTFAAQGIGTASAAETFVVSDLYGYAVGHPISISLPSPSNFTLPLGSTCTGSMVTNCMLSVALSPYENGPISESLTITDETTGYINYVQLTGTGGAAIASLSTSSVMFATRTAGTTSVPVPVTLTNTGQQPLSVTSISVSGAVNSNFTETNNCTTVAVNGSCTINVTFAPTISGMQSATVQIVSNAASSPDSISVSGTAN